MGTTQAEKFRLYRHVQSICDTAVRDGLLSPNPCQLNLKQPDRQVEPVILENAEVAAAADVIAPQYRALVLIGDWCGLRYGELGELRRKDISDNCEIITVARTFNHEGGCQFLHSYPGDDRPANAQSSGMCCKTAAAPGSRLPRNV